MAVFDKETIIGFAKSVDEELIKSNFEKLDLVLSETMSDLSKKNAIIGTNYKAVVFNEFAIGASTPISNIDAFLLLNSPQLEFNTVKLTKNKFKTFWNKVKAAWTNMRNKKKRKKKRKDSSENRAKDILSNKYTMSNFSIDLLNSITRYITPLSIASTTNCVLTITGEDFSFPVRIFPAIKKGDEYLIFDGYQNKFIKYNLSQRFKNLSEKFEGVEEEFLELCRIYYLLHYNIYSEKCNAFFIESLLYNMPHEVFSGDVYETFMNSINFFNNATFKSFISVLNKEKPMFKDEMLHASMYHAYDFIKNIKQNIGG